MNISLFTSNSEAICDMLHKTFLYYSVVSFGMWNICYGRHIIHANKRVLFDGIIIQLFMKFIIKVSFSDFKTTTFLYTKRVPLDIFHN